MKPADLHVEDLDAASVVAVARRGARVEMGEEARERVGASRDMVSRIFRDLTSGGYITVENRFITINKKPPARW